MSLRKASIRLIPLFLLALGTFLSAGVPATQPDSLRLIFMHINDVHGQVSGFGDGNRGVGGYARLSTVVKDLRKSNTADRVFLVHAGDEFSRGDDLTTLTRGQANIAIMNQLRFDFWTPGNGDFYVGLPAIQERVAEGKFRTLTSNLTVKATDRHVADPYIIEKAGDLKIAFFGLCSLREELPTSWAIDVADPIKTAARLVPRLRRQADLVVAVTHIGLDRDVDLAAKVDGIDLIIGSHSHSLLIKGMRVKGPSGREVLIVQAGEELQYAGRVDLLAARAGGGYQVTHAVAKLIPLDDRIKSDPAVTALIGKLSKAAADTQPAADPVLAH